MSTTTSPPQKSGKKKGKRATHKAHHYVAHKARQYVLPERGAGKTQGHCAASAMLTAILKAQAKEYAALTHGGASADKYQLRVTQALLACNARTLAATKCPAKLELAALNYHFELFVGKQTKPCVYDSRTGTGVAAVSGEQFALALAVPAADGTQSLFDSDKCFAYALNVNGIQVHQGLYRFSDRAAAGDQGETLVLRLPLYDERVLKRARKAQLAVNEIHLLLDHSASGVLVLRAASLQCFLRVRDAMHAPGCNMLAVVPRCGLSHHGMFAPQVTAPSPNLVTPAMPADVSTNAVCAFALRTLGTDAKWSAAAYQGKDELFYVGNVKNKRAQWRIGELTETVTNVSYVRYLTQNAGTASVDFHQPSLLRTFMERSGALGVYDALAEAFRRRFGAAALLPTLHQLLNHTSGLPEFFPHSAAELRDALARIAENRRDDSSVLETLVRVIRRGDVDPVAPPGALYQPSALGALMLRLCVPEWHTDAPERMVKADLVALKVERASFRCADATLAPLCASSSGKVGECARSDHGLYSLYSGLNIDASELAQFFSDANPWAADRSSNSTYGFMPYLLAPVTVVSKRDRVYAGFGWTHLRIKVADGDEVPIMCRIGHTPGAHVVIAVRVPQWRLSGVLCTNADIAALSGDARGSLYTLVSQFANVLVASGSKRALDAPSLHAVQFQPTRSAEYAAYRRYCRTQSKFATDAELHHFGKLREVRFYSVLDRLTNQPDQCVWFDTSDGACADNKAAIKSQKKQAYLRLNIQYGVTSASSAGGLPHRVDSLLLAYEPARSTLRIVDAVDGLMRDSVTVVALDSGAVVVSVRGRAYVAREVLDQLSQLQVGGLAMQQAQNSIGTAEAAVNAMAMTPQMRFMPADQLQRMMSGNSNAPAISNSVVMALLGSDQQQLIAAHPRGGFGAGLALGALGGGLVGLAASPYVAHRYGPGYYPYAQPGWGFCRRYPWAPECRGGYYW